MLMTDTLDIKGNLTIQKISGDHQIIETIHARNNIMIDGRDLVAKLFIKQPVETISYFAVGSGSNPNSVLANGKELNQEIFRKKLPDLTPENLQTITLTDEKDGKIERIKLSIKADLETGEANVTLTEAALFTGDKGDENPIMYNRVVFHPIAKTADFKLTLVWEIVF